MVRVTGDLGAFTGGLSVLNSVEVQVEFIGQNVDVLAVRSYQLSVLASESSSFRVSRGTDSATTLPHCHTREES